MTHYQNLAMAYMELRRFPESESHWRKTVEKCPSYLIGWLGLSEFYLTLQRFDPLEEVARNLEKIPGGALDAALLPGRILLGQKRFEEARRVFQKLLAEHSKSIEPLRFLSHAYLQEGKDWNAAEKVLREILMLDPDQFEAQSNLKVLLQQLGRAD